MEPTRTNLRRALDRILIGAFLIGIVAPTIDMFVRPAESRSVRREMREPAPPPDFSLTKSALWQLAPDIDAWWKDGFGLRDKFMRAHNALEALVFGVTPSTLVELGSREGWIFYSGERALEADLGLAPFKPKELDLWVRMLEARRRYLEQRGARFLLVWVPSKGVVYPEFLPRGCRPSGDTRVDQLIRALGPSWNDDLLDLRESQRAEKAFDRADVGDFAWYPLGTHWTERGAYAGYAAIAERLRSSFPNLEHRARNSFASELTDEPGDSWASRLYLDGWLTQPNWLFKLRRKLRAESQGQIGGNSRSERFVGSRPDAPRMLMFHDSMGPPLRPLLAELFSVTSYYWQFDFDTAKIEEAKPDVVIALFSDRSLGFVQPRVTASEAGLDLVSAFGRADRVLLHVDAQHGGDELTGDGTSEVHVEEDAIVADMQADDQLLILPRFEVPPEVAPLLHISIDSPFETKLEVLYRTTADPTFSRKRTYPLELKPGRNDLHCELFAQGLLGDLRIRPGRKHGRFVLHELEIRAPSE